MKVPDKDLLARFRRSPFCEWCRKPTPHGCHAAHVFAKGMGGGGRLDIPENLVALCPVCHQKQHDGQEPTPKQLLELVARREGKTVEAILDHIYKLRRTPKEER